MGEVTTKAQIVSNLRLLWLRSKERAKRLKHDDYSCCRCGVKASKAKGREQKVEVHHKRGICNWDDIIEVIRQQLLCDLEHLETLCPDCHKDIDNG